MGTVVAQDIFQYKLDAIFIGMEGVTAIADDMVIAGKDEMKHDRNFLAFMEKCMENNLTLNSEKIQFKQTQVSFYGHCWSKHFTRLTEEHCSQPCRISTRHGKYVTFPREPVPARKGEIHIGDQTEANHGYMHIHINIYTGDQSAAICGH